MTTQEFLLGYLSQFGITAWAMLAGGLWMVFWKLKRWPWRTLGVVAVLGLFAAYPGRWAWEVQKRVEHYQAAKAMYDTLCQTKSGYRINKVIEDVDGILLRKIRRPFNHADPMAPGAAFALEATDDGYINSFLHYRHPSSGVTDNSYMTNSQTVPGAMPGFRYVDVIDEKDGKRDRVTGRWEEKWQQDKRYLKGHLFFSLDRVPAPDPGPRYAVTFEDYVVPEERQYGIASSTVKVIDTQTDEVIAEMVRYVFYPGKLGSMAGANWGRADKCPGVLAGAHSATRQFVDRVLVARGATLPSPLN